MPCSALVTDDPDRHRCSLFAVVQADGSRVVTHVTQVVTTEATRVSHIFEDGGTQLSFISPIVARGLNSTTAMSMRSEAGVGTGTAVYTSSPSSVASGPAPGGQFRSGGKPGSGASALTTPRPLVQKDGAVSVVVTYAGSGARGCGDGAAVDASFDRPAHVALDAASGDLYVTEYNNNSIRVRCLCTSCLWHCACVRQRCGGGGGGGGGGVWVRARS